MSSFLLVVLSVLIGCGLAAAGDMVSQEIRDRLDHLPHAILRLAAYRLDPSKRLSVYVVEWIPELTYILRGDEARPVTRLYHGVRFALGILVAVRRIDRHLPQAEMAPDPPHALPLAESPPPPSQSGSIGAQADSDDRQRQPEPTAQRFVLGSNLRRLREDAGITMEQAATFIRSASATIYRMERGLVRFKEADIADLLSLYGVKSAPERRALMRLAREVDSSGWWQVYSDTLPYGVQPYFDLEAAALTIRQFEIQLVPALLQTEKYAQAVIRLTNCPSEEEVIRLTGARISRQEVLRRMSPPRLWAVVDEAALHRPIGGRQVMSEQLRHLIDMCEHPAITLQILPFAAGPRRARGGPFTIFRCSDLHLGDVVYIEQLTSALYLDRPTEAESYREAIDEICIQALPPAETKRVLQACLANM